MTLESLKGFRLHGLHLSCPAGLVPDGLLAEERSEKLSDAAVRIHPGRVPHRLPRADRRYLLWEATDDTFLLRIPAVARLLVEGGNRIRYEIHAQPAKRRNAWKATIPLLWDSVWFALLAQRGLQPIRASVVSDGRSATAILGPAQSGKSTLAAALCSQGMNLVCERFCVIHWVDDTPRVQPGLKLLELWPASLAMLQGFEGGTNLKIAAAIREGLSQTWAHPPDSAMTEAVPLRQVIRLVPRAVPQAGLSRVHGTESLQRWFVPHSRKECMAANESVNQQAEFDHFSRLAKGVPMCKLVFDPRKTSVAEQTRLIQQGLFS